MSGFLRRNKRSRAADTGDTSAEGLAAGPEGAPATETSAADASSAKTSELPAAAVAAPDAAAAASGPDAPVTAGPVARADAGVPAGLDAAEAGAKVTTGRRGRLRRRLRYLRRARELMLRDLGGLLYEVHRTGGGDVAAHSATIGAKIERLTDLDLETTAIETALGVSSGPAVVFEPGVGGTCESCGELYGSAARFCSNCGSPAGATVQAPPSSAEPLPAGATVQAPPSSAEPLPVPAMPEPPVPADTPAAADKNPPHVDATAPVAPGPTAATDEERPHEAPGTPQGEGDPPNGRAEPGRSSDDPLAAKRSTS